jgi:3-phenylpropionate/cinnamic acid dioxygenase small subunit
MDSDFIGMHHINDNLFTLQARIDRLETEYAWAERPPSRYRHHISNIRVRHGEADDELSVKSNVLVYITEGDDPDYTVISGERQDTLRKADDGSLRLAERLVYLDNTTLPLDKISVFI